MADSENESGQEKTEQPSEKRLREAREQGNVPRSRELATAIIMAASVFGVVALGSFFAHASASWMQEALRFDQIVVGDGRVLTARFIHLFAGLLLIASPLFLIGILASFVPPLLMGGFQFSQKAMTPNFGRLSPFSNLKRIWGMDGFAELVRVLLRVSLMAVIGGFGIAEAIPILLSLMHMPLADAISAGIGQILHLMVLMVAGLGLIALIDVAYQRWHYTKQLMMTRQELIEEMKETEGRPEVKSKIRRMQHEFSRRAMMDAVPTADVILVNPTHYAVAIKYQAEKMRAPTVVAKGLDEIALIIRQTAETNGVPIVAAPPLARALYREVKIGQEIPVGLYKAVAQILGYVYQLAHWRRHGGVMPSMPDIEWPKESS